MQTALLISVIVLVLLQSVLIIGGIFLSWVFYQMLKNLVAKLVSLDDAANLVVGKLEEAGETLKSLDLKADTLSESISAIVGPIEDLKGYNDGVVGGAKIIGEMLLKLTKLLSIWMKILHGATNQNGQHFQAMNSAAEQRAEDRMNVPLNQAMADFAKEMEQEHVRIVE